MSRWTRNDRLAALIAERSLLTRGFRESLRNLAREFTPLSVPAEELDGSEWDHERMAKLNFDEWFGDCSATPAAHRIVRHNSHNPECPEWGCTIEIYEVENTVEISNDKLQVYGWMADGEGPIVELHIIDKHDHEIVVPNRVLEPFSFNYLWSDEHLRLMLKTLRSRAVVQHHAPTITIDPEKERQIASLRRKLAKMEFSNIASIAQDVIYGLGRRQSHREIAQRTGIAPAAVRALDKLTKLQNVNPRELVADTHARWKAAYDAVRELGIQI